MGLGVLDTDESTSSSAISNQSSSRNTAISSQLSSVPPSSALSLAISENFGISEDSDDNANDRTLTHPIDDDENAVGHYSALPAQHEHGETTESDILNDFLLSDSSNSNDSLAKKLTSGSEYLQDYTPANLVPLSRVTLGVIPEDAAASATSAFKVFEVNAGPGQQQLATEGRAIRNTSLVKFSTTNSMQKRKGRSPLANVTCNSIHNNSGNQCPIALSEGKKLNDSFDGGFFMYQKEDPRIYKGEGEAGFIHCDHANSQLIFHLSSSR